MIRSVVSQKPKWILMRKRRGERILIIENIFFIKLPYPQSPTVLLKLNYTHKTLFFADHFLQHCTGCTFLWRTFREGRQKFYHKSQEKRKNYSKDQELYRTCRAI